MPDSPVPERTEPRPEASASPRPLRRRRGFVAPLLGALGALAVWELGVRAFGVASYVLPPPSSVWTAFWEVRPLINHHLWATVGLAVGGLAAGTIAGIVVAVVLAAVDVLRRSLQPLLVASQSIPSVILAPILVSLWGFGFASRIAVVGLVVLFPVAVATLDGLTGADRELNDLVRSMGASPRQRMRWVRIPAALPSFFSGLRIAAAYAMFGAIVAEWMGGDRGLGVYFNRARASYRMDRVLVAIVVIATVSVLLYTAVSTLSRRSMPWSATGRQRSGEEP